MPSTPLSASSSGTPTVFATVSASAPGNDADTDIWGGATSGYCLTGRLNAAMAPASIRMTAMTIANRGRLMKNVENMGYFFPSADSFAGSFAAPPTSADGIAFRS